MWQVRVFSGEALIVAQGFENVPFVEEDSGGRQGIGAHRGDRDWVAQNGFGFAPVLFASGQFVADPDDPNVEYLAGLPEGSRLAWEAALWGDEVEDGPNDPLSCFGQAEREVFGFFDDLEDAYFQYIARVESDPQSVALDREWSACMRASGFEFDDTRELLAAVAENVNQVSPALQIELAAGDTAISFEGDPVFDPDLVAQAQDEEVRMALAEFDCSLEQQQARQDIDFRYQQQTVDENFEALSAWNN